MAAATVTNKLEGVLAEDNVVLTISDGETYTTKLSSILGVQFSFNEDMGALAVVPGVAISGRTITFHCTGVTDKLVMMTVKGRV